MCQKCYEKINEIVLYRNVCSATNIQLILSQSNRIAETTIGVANAVRENDADTANSFGENNFPNCNTPVAFISLIDDDSESDNGETNVCAVDELNAVVSIETAKQIASNVNVALNDKGAPDMPQKNSKIHSSNLET